MASTTTTHIAQSVHRSQFKLSLSFCCKLHFHLGNILKIGMRSKFLYYELLLLPDTNELT